MPDTRRQSYIAMLPVALSLLPVAIITMTSPHEAFGVPVRFFGYAMIAACIGLLLMIVVGLARTRPEDQSNSPS